MKALTQEDSRRARQMLQGLGIPEEVFEQAERSNPELNWLKMVWALDGVFLSWGGAMGQVGFLQNPQPELDGRKPVDVLGEDTPGSFEEVRKAARSYAERGPYFGKR